MRPTCEPSCRCRRARYSCSSSDACFQRRGSTCSSRRSRASRLRASGRLLLIAGDDAGTGYRSTVEKLIRDSGVAHKVRLLGEVRGDRKFEVMRGADVFVLPSYSEGLPVAVLEAMACGVPVVVTSNCNLPEVSAADAGWRSRPMSRASSKV